MARQSTISRVEEKVDGLRDLLEVHVKNFDLHVKRFENHIQEDNVRSDNHVNIIKEVKDMVDFELSGKGEDTGLRGRVKTLEEKDKKRSKYVYMGLGTGTSALLSWILSLLRN